MKLKHKRLLACLFLISVAPLGWADIVSDNSSMYGSDLGDRLVVASHNGRYFICNDPKLGDSTCTGKSSDWTAPYATPGEAIKSAVSKGYCGQPDFRTLTCYTGAGSSTDSNGEVGTPTTTTTPSPATQTGKSCGSMVNGVWVSQSCSEPAPMPNTPEPSTPTAPTPRKLTPQQQALIDAFKSLRDRYVAAMKALEQEAINVKENLAISLRTCVSRFGAGTPQHRACAESAASSAKRAIERIKEQMAEAQAQMEKDFSELEKQIPNAANVGSINVDLTGGSQDSGGVNVKVDGADSNNSATGDTVVNNNNTSTTTVNNTTVNNGGNTATTVVNNGSKNNATTSQPNNSADTGLLSDIKGILKGISDKIGSGNESGTSGQTGKGDKGDPNGKENGEDNGETMSEFCEKNPQHLSCTKLGTKGEIEDAIAAGKGNDGRGFGIGEKEFGIPKLSRTSDFTETGSCPPPKTFRVLNSQQEISYQPLCDGALKIRPFVIFCAIFIAFGLARASITNS